MSIEQPLPERLAGLEPQSDEPRSNFLGRLAHIAACHAEEQYPFESITELKGHVPGWQFRTADSDLLALRPLGSTRPDADAENTYEWLATAGEQRLLTAQRAVTGAFIAKLLRTEIEIFRQTFKEPLARDAKGGVPLRGIIYLPPTGRNQERLLSLLYLDSVAAAEAAGISSAPYAYHLLYSTRIDNGMTEEELVKAALVERRVDTTILPAGISGLNTLSPREIQLIEQHAFETHEQSGPQFSYSKSRVRDWWREIHRKSGTQDKRAAYIWAFFHKYIELGEAVAEGSAETIIPLELTAAQREVVELLPLQFPAIGQELGGLDERSVRKRYIRAIEYNNLSEEEFVRAAFVQGLVNENLLPSGRPAVMGDRELYLLQNFAFKTDKEAAAVTGLTADQCKKIWTTKILKAMSTNNRRAAFLAGFRNKLIR